MNRIGLALSGGGFRATLYHLGLTRFLRDAGILSQVTQITSVSGGSIFAAHLVLNWDRYNGSPREFDAAASELLSVVRLDLRNRITRRFPLTIPFRWPLRLLGVSNRKLTRTGLLEYLYEKYLYGDTSLFQLPEKPQLHILATNLSEGSLCSFNRDGLLTVRRETGKHVSYRPHPYRTGHGAHGRRRLFGLPRVLPAARVDGNGRRRQRRRVRPAGVYRWRRLRQSRHSDVSLPGTVDLG